MSQEKTSLDCVSCPNSFCRMIFTRRELESLGELLVIPEHRDASTEAICSGSFKTPAEGVSTDFPVFRKIRKGR